MPNASFRDERPGLYCVELRTSNWEASVEWYRNVLGLRVLVRVTDDGYGLLDAGETRLAILAREVPGEATRRISLALEVPDLAAVADRLKRAGTTFTPPRSDREGLREINTVDPDGNRLRLFNWPKAR